MALRRSRSTAIARRLRLWALCLAGAAGLVGLPAARADDVAEEAPALSADSPAPLPSKRVHNAGFKDCLTALSKGRPVRREPIHGTFVVEVPEADRQLRALPPRQRDRIRSLLAHESRDMSLCRDVLAASLNRDLPRWTFGVVGLGLWVAYSASFSIAASLSRAIYGGPTWVGSVASLAFVPVPFIGAPAWRQLGVRRALELHAEGSPLGPVLRREVYRSWGTGLMVSGAAVLLGGLAIVLPSTFRDGGAPNLFFALGHTAIGTSLLIVGSAIHAKSSHPPEAFTMNAAVVVPWFGFDGRRGLGGLVVSF